MDNPNLGSGQVVPGFFGYIDYNAQGGSAAASRRALLWGYVGSTAQRTLNQPWLPSSQQEADDGCERGSDLARFYAAALSQPGATDAEVWLMPIAAPSGGVASVYKYTVIGTPLKPGTINLAVSSQSIAAVGFTTSDTASTIATALAAAITALKDSSIASAAAVGAVITVTYKHKGTTGEDFPVRCDISPSGSGMVLSPGTLTIAVNATGAGSIKVAFGALSVSTAIANADTPAQMAAKVIASFNADSYPMAAQANAVPEKVDLVFVNGKDVRRLIASVLTSTGTTVDLGSGATDGTGSASSLSYNGTLGTGAPSLSAALTNLTSLDSFRSWAVPWLDAATVGAIATHIESNSDGSINGQKQQVLTIVGTSASSVDGAVAPATSPNLTTSAPHYGIGWSPDAPVQGMELAARIAVKRATVWLDEPRFNFNGYQVRGSSRAPILLPPTRPSLDAQNTALRTYALAPVVKGRSGYLEVVKGRSTSLATDKRLWAWSAEAQAAFHHFDLGDRFSKRLGGASIVRYGEPKAAGLFDTASIESIVREALVDWEKAGHYDGAEALAPLVKATIDPGNPFRFNVKYPESPVVDLDQVVYTAQFASPAQ